MMSFTCQGVCAEHTVGRCSQRFTGGWIRICRAVWCLHRWLRQAYTLIFPLSIEQLALLIPSCRLPVDAIEKVDRCSVVWSFSVHTIRTCLKGITGSAPTTL